VEEGREWKGEEGREEKGMEGEERRERGRGP